MRGGNVKIVYGWCIYNDLKGNESSLSRRNKTIHGAKSMLTLNKESLLKLSYHHLLTYFKRICIHKFNTVHVLNQGAWRLLEKYNKWYMSAPKQTERNKRLCKRMHLITLESWDAWNDISTDVWMYRIT